jgi:hypothetical protein
VIRHDPYAVSPPREPFDYVVDDEPIRRAPVGSPRLLDDEHSALRLAPDSLFRSWRNEYVTVREDVGIFDRIAPVIVLKICGAVYLYPRGIGADLLDFEASVVDPAGQSIISVGAGQAHRVAVGHKIVRVLDWYRAEMKLREKGSAPLLTAFQLWTGTEPMRRAS